MTAISQSILENNLYTEIYRTGNQEIIYHLLNTIFNEKIKEIGELTMEFQEKLIKLNQAFENKKKPFVTVDACLLKQPCQ